MENWRWEASTLPQLAASLCGELWIYADHRHTLYTALHQYAALYSANTALIFYSTLHRISTLHCPFTVHYNALYCSVYYALIFKHCSFKVF